MSMVERPRNIDTTGGHSPFRTGFYAQCVSAPPWRINKRFIVCGRQGFASHPYGVPLTEGILSQILNIDWLVLCLCHSKLGDSKT